MAAVTLVAAGACSSEPQPYLGTGGGPGACGQAGVLECNGSCVPSDNSNCGACGVMCAPGLMCNGVQCVCQPPLQDCGMGCTDVQANSQNCGACGVSCGPGLVCSQGGCATGCAPGLVECNGGCINPMGSDALNCGACGNACAAGQACMNGTCSCASGSPCNGACVSLTLDPANCGACGVVCPSGQCLNGVCSPVIGAGGTGGMGTGGGGAVGTGAMPSGGNPPVGGGGNPPVGGGGSTTGGTPPTGGSSGSGGGGSTGDPPGYWRYIDWHGCAWTGIDDTGVGTTVTPTDFTAHTQGEPYCASGSVGPHPDYESVALLGFNLNEDSNTSCAYDPAAATSVGPPGVTMGASGIAANIVKQGTDTNFTFRVQIQGSNGAIDENDRWCATITATQGKIFVPYEDFNTKCWDGTGNDYAGEPISAVVFLVPGEPTAVPYSFCVNGFAAGNSAEDAPDGTANPSDQTGTVGFTEVSPDGDFDRAKVLVDGEEYIIQNNNWGNPQGTNLLLNFVNNSFTVAEGQGSTQGGGVPASFPSIYVGANGETANGVYATSGTDNLPRQISNINSAQTSFAWSGSTTQFNATYDVWFASAPPTTMYEDGIDGFVMVWVHDPSNYQPIGNDQGDFTYDSHTFDVWVGPRGEGPAGYNSAPVVSFVSRGDIGSWSFDLKRFIDEAAGYGIGSNLFLTDVFFGFEIWEGGAGGNLKVDSFTIDVQ